ncbi:serpin family protein [Candidatus Woesearchaeota archaeon]|nr:MAG: serpin family protein [Candidatus Woesearchaeota archaeon]
MKKILLFLLILLLSSCQIESEQSYDSLVTSNNEFALKMYNNLGEGNLFFSPYNIYSAMAMAFKGSSGLTKQQFLDFFHYPKNLDQQFSSYESELNYAKSYNLHTANALWLQKDFSLEQPYVGTIKKYYNGEITTLDFIHETEESRKVINAYVEDKTNNKIKNLIPAGAISEFTRLVITSVIYFKGTWQVQFDKSLTKRSFFHSSSGDIETDMMVLNPNDKRFNYTETEDFQMLELPYSFGMAMYIILPKEDINGVESKLSVSELVEWQSRLKPTEISHIEIPKFKLSTDYFLKDKFSSLGLNLPFSSSSDFSAMTKDKLFIDEVIHKAFIEVNEEGTEAAAATAIIMRLTSVNTKQINFIADHPFIFFIQDKHGNILFMGRLVKPNNTD